jgi:hypothetical protein
MPTPLDAPASLYTSAWLSLLAIFTICGVLSVWFHRRSKSQSEMTRYDPPPGISPALAAFLCEDGRFERAFAAALVSLAAKGYLQIAQKAGSFSLKTLKKADNRLPPEESVILDKIFLGDVLPEYSFDSRDCTVLFDTYRDFSTVLEGAAVPALMSDHIALWLVGLAGSLAAVAPVLFSMPSLGNNLPPQSIAFLLVMIAVTGSCFVAALRIWPATLRKLASFLPAGIRPRRPFEINDGIPMLLTGSSFLGFGFLAIVTSNKFAALATAVLAMNVFTRHLLDSPTRAGRNLLAQLSGFRDFLSRVEADRMNRQNQPGETPGTLDHFSPYRVALGVEHGWGEEFASNLLELLQIEQAYSGPERLHSTSRTSEEFNLFNHKR